MSGFVVEEAATPDIGMGNAAAELSLLCELLNDNRLIDSVADICRVVDFSDHLCGRIFGVVVDQASAGRAVDAITLTPAFRDDDDWHDRKIYGTLAAANLNAMGWKAAKAYSEQIAELARRRRLVTGLRQAINSARDLTIPSAEIVVEVDEAAAEVSDVGAATDQAPAADYARIAIASFGQPVAGVRSGLIGSLDDVVGDLRPGSLTVIGARPGMAKTATAISYSLGAASRGHGVLLASLEMTGDELVRRMLADLCLSPHGGGVPYDLIRDGRVKGRDLEAVIAAQARLDDLPLEITDPSGLTLAMLARRVRRHKRRLAARGLQLNLLIVDYLTLLKKTRPNLSPYEHASEISVGLKELSRRESIAVMALAQLNRAVEQRADKRPMASDLRDSGQIEQDADAIVLLYREAKYMLDEKPDDENSVEYADWFQDYKACEKRIEFIVPKRRNGPEGRALGYFFGSSQAVRGSDFFRLGGVPQ